MATSSSPADLEDLEIRSCSPEDEARVVELLSAELPGWRGRDALQWFRWKHRNGPFGPSLVHLAVLGDQLVGVGTRMHWRLRLDGRKLLAGRHTDVAIHPDFQRRGIGRALTVRDSEMAHAEGVELHFHHGNVRSDRLSHSIGYADGVRPTMHVAPLRPLRLLRRRLGRPTKPSSGSAALPPAAEALADEAAVNDLLARAEPRGRMVTARSVAYLRWRYVDVPGRAYVAARLHGRDGQLRGLLVGRHVPGETKEMLDHFEVSEVIVDQDDRAAMWALLRRVWRVDAVYAAVVLPVPVRHRWEPLLAGFPRARQRELRFTALPMTQDIDLDVADIRNWALPLGDLEVF